MKTLLIVSVLYCSFAVQAQIKKTTNSSTEMKNVNTVQHQGRTYKTVKIGDQVWMAENLRAKKFRNADPIQEIKTIDDSWTTLDNDKPAWHHPENNPINGKKLGLFYNYYVVTDDRKICPQGWHVPRLLEWNTLFENVEKMRLSGLIEPKLVEKLDDWGNWKYGNTDKSKWPSLENISYFNALPTWEYRETGSNGTSTKSTCWWTNTESETNLLYYISFVAQEIMAHTNNGQQWCFNFTLEEKPYGSRTYGLGTIRCIKNKK